MYTIYIHILFLYLVYIYVYYINIHIWIWPVVEGDWSSAVRVIGSLRINKQNQKSRVEN